MPLYFLYTCAEDAKRPTERVLRGIGRGDAHGGCSVPQHCTIRWVARQTMLLQFAVTHVCVGLREALYYSPYCRVRNRQPPYPTRHKAVLSPALEYHLLFPRLDSPSASLAVVVVSANSGGVDHCFHPALGTPTARRTAQADSITVHPVAIFQSQPLCPLSCRPFRPTGNYDRGVRYRYYNAKTTGGSCNDPPKNTRGRCRFSPLFPLLSL